MGMLSCFGIVMFDQGSIDNILSCLHLPMMVTRCELFTSFQ